MGWLANLFGSSKSITISPITQSIVNEIIGEKYIDVDKIVYDYLAGNKALVYHKKLLRHLFSEIENRDSIKTKYVFVRTTTLDLPSSIFNIYANQYFRPIAEELSLHFTVMEDSSGSMCFEYKDLHKALNKIKSLKSQPQNDCLHTSVYR